MIGKRGNKKDTQNGWIGENKDCRMTITFSMSSQLWIRFKTELIKDFLICQTEVNSLNEKKIDFIDLYDILYDIKR